MLRPTAGEVVVKSVRRATASDSRLTLHDAPAGWYPDPDDPSSLRYWDGLSWSQHRAALTTASNAPAVCSCGVVATGSCRVCTRPFCRTHISSQQREDRAFQKRWPAWTCESCIEDDQREIRAMQLQNCEDIAAKLSAIPRMKRMRITTGYRPRQANLFDRLQTPGERPVRSGTSRMAGV